jgi:endonuclease/exonuclease/phosphatase family metal-dependent hydrolase
MDIFVAHIPNGSGNGWRKIETFEALALGLGRAPARPRILGGDFNEPKHVLPHGEIIPFGGIQRADGRFHWEGERFHSKSRDKHSRARWRNGVLGVLGPDAEHSLRHVWIDRYGYLEVVTHMTRALNERFFDHLLVSNHFAVIDAGYHDDGWRTHGPSDHSAAWARIELL